MLVVACAPHAGPLGGVAASRELPGTSLPPGHRRIVFRWEYHERVFSGRGDGVARIAAPDSVRLDFYLDNGAQGGFVILVGDSLTVPSQTATRRYLPPVPLLWAALGRITMTHRDTLVHVDGDTLRAEIGHDPTWRIAFGHDAPVRVERINGGRIEESVERSDSNRVLYRSPRSGRSLSLTITGRFNEAGFDHAIWRP